MHKQHVTQRYCVICNKAGMTDQKYMSHSYEECTGMRTKWNIKDGMRVYVGSRADTVKQYKKSEKMEEISERS